MRTCSLLVNVNISKYTYKENFSLKVGQLVCLANPVLQRVGVTSGVSGISEIRTNVSGWIVPMELR